MKINPNNLAMYKTMQSISSGKRINSASDDAAGLAIAKKLEAQVSGLSRGTANIQDSVNLSNVAESSLSSVHDNLQRMRELAVQANSGILTADDKKIIQQEIDIIKESINDISSNTEFNTHKLLDGTFRDKIVSGNANGGGQKLSFNSISIDALGLKDFDVTKGSDLKALDDAINKVSSDRSTIGASTNRMEHNINSNETTRMNTLAAQSRIEDAELYEAISKLRSQQTMSQVQTSLQKMQINTISSQLNLLG